MTDWLKAAQSQEKDYLNDLTALMKIPSVRDDAAEIGRASCRERV